MSLSEMDSHVCLHAWLDRDARRLMEHLCLKIGPRPAGSRAVRDARAYLAAELEAMDAVDVHEEEVQVRLWHPGNPMLGLQQPEVRTFESVQGPFSASSDIAAPLVNVATGSQDDFHRLWPGGTRAVAMMEGPTISGGKFEPLQKRIQLAAARGAAAVILRGTDATGRPAIEVSDLTGDCPLPCLSVSKEVGGELETLARQGAAIVQVRTAGWSEPAVCANLVADMGPDAMPEETLVLGAHLDSFQLAPGALDNLSGLVTVFEIARLLAPFRSSFTRRLRVIAYTGEELAFLGSKAYVSRHAAELDKVRFVVNMDSLASATSRGTAVMWSSEMRDYIARSFQDAGRQVDVRNLFCMSSDYLPFMLQGVPACRPADFEQSLPIWSHTDLDDLDHFRIDWIQHNAMVYAQLLCRMLTDPAPLPSRRLSPDQVRAKLESEDVLESLALCGLR